MASTDYTKLFETIESHELNEVLNVSLISSFGVRVLQICEPFMFIWNIRKSLELISSECAFLKLGKKIGIHRGNFRNR